MRHIIMLLLVGGCAYAAPLATCEILRYASTNAGGDPVYSTVHSLSGNPGCVVAHSETVSTISGPKTAAANADAFAAVNFGDDTYSISLNAVAGHTVLTLGEIGQHPSEASFLLANSSASIEFETQPFLITNPLAVAVTFANLPQVRACDDFRSGRCDFTGEVLGNVKLKIPFRLLLRAAATADAPEGGQASLSIELTQAHFKPTVRDAGGNVIPESDWQKNAVPEAGTLWLLASGLFAVYARKRYGVAKTPSGCSTAQSTRQ